jgi:hypothetical protein
VFAVVLSQNFPREVSPYAPKLYKLKFSTGIKFIMVEKLKLTDLNIYKWSILKYIFIEILLRYLKNNLELSSFSENKPINNVL